MTATAIVSAELTDLEPVMRAVASERRLKILEWLKDPRAHFPPQVHGDPDEHGACNQFIVEKLGISQPAGSRHMKILTDAGLVIPTRREGYTYYKRDESAIAAFAEATRQI